MEYNKHRMFCHTQHSPVQACTVCLSDLFYVTVYTSVKFILKSLHLCAITQMPDAQFAVL